MGLNVAKVYVSTNDFEIKRKKYVSHSVFDTVDMRIRRSGNCYPLA